MIKDYLLGLLCGTLFGIAIFGLISLIYPTMSPMDVYQGKTTLEYKVVNGEIVDSCVIWNDYE